VITAYVSIGNSDDKLSQDQWSRLHADVRAELIGAGGRFHGQWVSPSTSGWQNACWCVEIADGVSIELRRNLARLAVKYGQDSIAWAEAPATLFLGSADA
jgi:hypothetical protein